MTLKSDQITEIISSFVDEHYPKGKEERGFAIMVLATFLLALEENTKWKIVMKESDQK